MKTFLFSYEWRGGEYVMEVDAETEAEARHRHLAMAKATYDGELVVRVPVMPGWLARLFGIK